MASTKKQKQEKVTFIARRSNLRLVEVSGYTTTDARGRQTAVAGSALEFMDGRLVVDGDKDDTLEFLRDHPLNGNAMEGFVELPAAVPAPDETLTDIVVAGVDLDEEKLQGILDEERGSHNRPVILQTAQVTLESVVAAKSAMLAKDNQDVLAEEAARQQEKVDRERKQAEEDKQAAQDAADAKAKAETDARTAKADADARAKAEKAKG